MRDELRFCCQRELHPKVCGRQLRRKIVARLVIDRSQPRNGEFRFCCQRELHPNVAGRLQRLTIEARLVIDPSHPSNGEFRLMGDK